MGALYAPRRMELEALIRALVVEHATMRKGLQRAKEAAGKNDFGAVSRTLRELEPVFRQHIADEEAQILGLLVKQLGVKGAADEIRVFRQHKPIYQLMKKVEELAVMPTSELAANQAKLDTLFNEHTAAEEAGVFPRAVSLHRSNA